MTFVTDDEAERTLWVQAIYRATGQSHKPVPPVSVSQPSITSNMTLSRMQGGQSRVHDAVTHAGRSVHERRGSLVVSMSAWHASI